MEDLPSHCRSIQRRLPGRAASVAPSSFASWPLRNSTHRESLRDIEVCLAAQAGKLYHMGIGAAVARSTLADANELRDWRIYFELAQRLIIKARALYVDEDFGVELANTVYALDATTIDLCLSMFPWAPFRSTKAAVKLHTLLDLRGIMTSTNFDISDGKYALR